MVLDLNNFKCSCNMGGGGGECFLKNVDALSF